MKNSNTANALETPSSTASSKPYSPPPSSPSATALSLTSHDDASSAARAIEEEAFATASASETVSRSELSIDDDGIEILQIYSKEISKRMLETVKAKAAAAAAPPVTAAAPGTSEDVSPGESETS
ncbi:hypothetical protein Scep_007899 [Stephania cephalantha]|uniref:WPP domain-containing protein n=1 Tax=Stephania cephalantha TaxID=152367 RepID=A0AAP0KAZ3_9MAGN